MQSISLFSFSFQDFWGKKKVFYYFDLSTYSFSFYMKTADDAAPILATSNTDANGDFIFVVGGDARDANEIPASDYSITLYKD